MTAVEVGTSQGPALVDLMAAPGGAPPRFLLALTHGAGGTVRSPDLLAVRDAALRLGGTVALITQPYRVRGARAPGSAPRQDDAWREVIASLPGGALGTTVPLIVGGRSNGARVACRTAAAVGARGVVALAFPLRPPPRRARADAGVTAPPTRAAELREAVTGGAEVLVVDGERDPFGIPETSDAVQVVVLKGETHSLSKDPAAVASAVTTWLTGVVPLMP